MFKLTRIIIIFLVVVFGGLTYIALTAKKQESLALLTTEIINANERLIKAYAENNTDELSGLLSLGHTHNNIFGMTQDRETLLNDIRNGTLKFEYYRNPEFNIRFYSNNDICIATGIIEAKAIRNNKIMEGKFRFTRVFVKQGNHWREELFQNTMIVNPPAFAETLAGRPAHESL